MLKKDAFCLDCFGLFCRHDLNSSSVLHDLRNLDDCTSILNLVCIKSSLQIVVDHHMLSLSL